MQSGYSKATHRADWADFDDLRDSEIRNVVNSVIWSWDLIFCRLQSNGLCNCPQDVSYRCITKQLTQEHGLYDYDAWLHLSIYEYIYVYIHNLVLSLLWQIVVWRVCGPLLITVLDCGLSSVTIACVSGKLVYQLSPSLSLCPRCVWKTHPCYDFKWINAPTKLYFFVLTFWKFT